MSPDPPSFYVHANVRTRVQVPAGPMQLCFRRACIMIVAIKIFHTRYHQMGG